MATSTENASLLVCSTADDLRNLQVPNSTIVYALVTSQKTSLVQALKALANCSVIVYSLDEFDEEVEEAAMEVGLTKVPSAVVVSKSGVTLSKFDGYASEVQAIQAVVDKGDRGVIAQGYAATVNNDVGGGCCVSVDSTMNGYTREQLLAAGKDADLGLGCGNPVSLAELKQGEVVVDLGR